MAYRLHRASKAIPAIALTALTVLLVKKNLQTLQAEEITKKPAAWIPPSRLDMIARLKSLKDNKPLETPTVYDLLIIGGGATGVGCAVDAATRGLNVALVERDDFSCGTSSRSTKLIHGGVRYLEKAFLELDYDQYKLVREALHERGTFMKIAPYLSYEIPIMLPLKTWWKMPYYFAGAKVYDLLAGSHGLSQAYFLTKSRAVEAFPMLKKETITGAIVYYDGAHNDSRMNVALALTAVQHGATVANHVEVVKLLKKPRESGKSNGNFGKEELCGAVVRDTITGDTWTVHAKGIINATGPFCDSIRKMDGGVDLQEIVAPSAGVHIVLPSYFSPKNMGLIDPNTSDGRVIFFLPWQGSVLAGTTDSPTKVDPNPVPGDEDINWILKEVGNYLSPGIKATNLDIKLRRGDVQAAWSGIRPLVRDPAAKNTESLVRNHMINVSPSGLLTIAGGKWTTYRAMAEETIDKAIEVFDLKPKGPCVTTQTLLVGSHLWSKNMFIKLIQHFGLEPEVAKYLAETYGDQAWTVASLASQTGNSYPLFGKRIAQGYPYIEAEIRHACRSEYACSVVDVLARRTRLMFLNAKASLEALPRVIEIMASELGWDEKEKQQQATYAKEYLKSMGLSIKDQITFPADGIITHEVAFVPGELDHFKKVFNSFDVDKDGHITQKDLAKAFKTLGIKFKEEDLQLLISEVDFDKNGAIEFNEFVQCLAAVKDIKSRKKFERLLADYEDRQVVDPSRSGGGI